MRILSIDYGKKRTGIAVSDPLQIIANGLTTVDTKELIPFLKKYFQTEQVHRKNWQLCVLHSKKTVPLQLEMHLVLTTVLLS